MASSFRRRIAFAEKRAVCPELESWLAVLLQCVGVEKLLDLINGTGLVVDLQLFKDYKASASSTRPFDDSCFFCCARREKVKDHVAALNRRIVESGGKPLLTKDQSNVVRLEGQIEEFLGALVRRTEYKPRIPDPHIPVVARDVLLQIIRLFLVHFTSATPAVSTQNPVLSKLLMPDQDAPLDLSVRKVKSELRDQDCVLDLSIKKSRIQEPEPQALRNASPVCPAEPGVTGDSLELGLVKDLHSVTSLEDLMARLCSHHQRSIVDAFTFLEAEINSVPPEMDRSGLESEAINGSPASQTDDGSTGANQKCLTLFIVKNRNSGNLEAKKLPDASPDTVTLEPDAQNSTSDSKAHRTPGGTDTSNSAVHSVEVSPRLSKTARKSIKASQCHPRDTLPAGRISGDQDSAYDIVYVAKPITECGLAQRGSVLPKKNARKSTRGHRYLGACWEIETVRTLACGNCAVRMPEMTTSVTPRQALTKPDGVPALATPYAGDCVEADSRMEAPGDVVETTNEAIIVEPSQTGQCVADAPVHQDLSGGVDFPTPEGESSNCDPQPDTQKWSEHIRTQVLKSSDSRLLDTESTVGSAQGTDSNLTKEILEVFTEDDLIPSKSHSPSLKDVEDLDLGSEKTLAKETKLKERELQGSFSEQMPLRNGGGTEEPCSSKMLDDTLDGTLGKTVDMFQPSEAARNPAERPEQIPLRSRNSMAAPAKMPLRSRNNIFLNQSVVGDSRSNSSMPERMPLRSMISSHVDPSSVESCGSLSASPAQRQGCMPLRSMAITALEQSSPPEKAERVHLRSRNGTSADHPDVPQPCSEVSARVPQRPEQVPCDEQANLEESHDSPLDSFKKQMPLKHRSSTSLDCSRSPEKLERMPLRSRSSIGAEHPCASQHCSTVSETPPERLEQVPLRSRGTASVEQDNLGELHDSHILLKSSSSTCHEQSSSPKKPERMPLRSRSSTGVEHPCSPQPGSTVSARPPERPEKTPLRSRSSTSLKQPSPSEKAERSLLRSRTGTGADHPCPQTIHTTNAPRPCSTVSTRSPERLEQTPQRSKTNISVDQSSLKESHDSPSVSSPKKPERMPLRSRTGNFPNQISFGETGSSAARQVVKSEWMPERSCISATLGDSSGPNTGHSAERQERMSLRSRSSTAANQQNIPMNRSETPEGTKASLVESPKPDPLQRSARVPLRTRHNQASPQTKPSEIVAHMPSQDRTCSDSQGADLTRIKMESLKHMPLRSESTHKAPDSPLRELPVSPGPMSLRASGSSEKPAHSQTVSKCEKPSWRSSKKSLLHFFQEAGPSLEGSTVKTKSKVYSPAPFTLFNIAPSRPDDVTPCKFLEALSCESGQRSLLDLNSKFEKMHRGWVHMDKEGQPAARPKNKADRLKEIWKSKRRIKKSRTLEQQRVSPVQMLFMKAFDLPSICRWFLQTTETKSLVIVKKVNTRLPSETHLGFPSYASSSESPGVFPSLQAERLKKHLKKFAILSPVRSNPKNKRLIAQALAKGASRDKNKREKRTAVRIPSKPLGHGDSHSKKNPASARILRKYSNMREKKHVTLKTSEQASRDFSRGPGKVRKGTESARNRAPMPLEDQVLTRSQRKLDIELSPTGVIKVPKRRGLDPELTLAKRSRTK